MFLIFCQKQGPGTGVASLPTVVHINNTTDAES